MPTASDMKRRRILKIDKSHLRPDGPFHVVGLTRLELNLAWTHSELKRVIDGWNNGLPFWEINESVKRQEIETAFLILELSELGVLKPRKGGIYGGE